MERLTELDASFLYLETERTPLHVGGAFVFKKPPRSKYNFAKFKNLIESKLCEENFFKQRVLFSSLNLDLPVWVDDWEFNIDNHLSHTELQETPSPCTLNELAASIMARPLDRQRPLWNICFIDGLENESDYSKDHFALVIKIHMSAIDGNSGEDVLSKILKVAPETISELEPASWKAEPPSPSSSWIDEAYSNALTIPKKLALLAKDTAASLFYGEIIERLKNLGLGDLLNTVASTPINQKVSSNRIIDTFSISAQQIRDIKTQLDSVTTNDVIMGICAEALACYLQDQGNNSKHPLIALSPISVRSTSLEVKSGNKLAASLFSLVTNEDDPVERIKRIHESALLSSNYEEAIAASRLTELIPSCMAGLASRVYSEFLLAQKHKPLFNLPITNIPGPQFPLYMDKNELVKHICVSPLFDGIGMGIKIVSYKGNFDIAITYCPELYGANNESFSIYMEKALSTIVEYQKSNENEDQENSEPKRFSGYIEDAVGLVSNLFSSNSSG